MKRILLPVLIVSILLLGACGCPTASEPEIPAHYTTYTDEAGLFSISYPPEWETVLYLLPDLQAAVEDIITSIESDLPLENAYVIFLAGLPIEEGYEPNVNIVVESIPDIDWTHDSVVEAAIDGAKEVIQDYQEFLRLKTTVDGREATIIECEGTYPHVGKCHNLLMITSVGKTIWIVTCSPLSGEFSEWEEDFHAIVRSLRILK